MANTDAFGLHLSDLNGFLFAEIGVEANEMTLTVLSALARLDKDPWAEAGHLAKQPRRLAAAELARVIAGMPGSLWPLPEATTIAKQLVTLLPARGSGATLSRLARAAEAAPPDQPRPAPRVQNAAPTAGAGRPSAVVIAMLAALLAGLTLDLAGQRTGSEHGAVKPAMTSALNTAPTTYEDAGQAAGQ